MNRDDHNESYMKTVEEISRIREEILERGRRLQILASDLHREVRRQPSDENTAIYMTYSNSVLRYAGMVEQASVRTERTARILQRLTPNHELEAVKRASREQAERKARASQTTETPVDYLIRLYGGVSGD